MSSVTLQDLELLRQELATYHVTHEAEYGAIESCTERVCVQVKAGIEILNQHLENIRARAYELYLARGKRPGYELDDWAQAERDVLETRASSAA